MPQPRHQQNITNFRMLGAIRQVRANRELNRRQRLNYQVYERQKFPARPSE
jgi:hypothetical protein